MLAYTSVIEENPNLRPFEVRDDQMYKEFKRGDFAFVDVTELKVLEGLYLFDVFGTHMIYRVTRGPGVAVLSKDCPHYQTQTVPIQIAEERVLGRVVASLKRV